MHTTWTPLSRVSRCFQRRGVVFSLPLVVCLALFKIPAAFSQSLSPVIVEYTDKADGKIEVKNDTLAPMAVVLEPQSFNIDANGKNTFRPLDPGIHIKLSTTSLRLAPLQSAYVFYKASADTLPVWFTVYASFTPIKKDPGLNVRVMLPHVVYLYDKEPFPREAIHIKGLTYQQDKNMIVCDMENVSRSLIRVQEVRAADGRKITDLSGGFPLLPGGTRHLEMEWKQPKPPEALLVDFPKFNLKEPVAVKSQ